MAKASQKQQTPRDSQIHRQARALLVRARMYRYVGIIFALTGLALFIVFYFSDIEGRLLEALQNPTIIGFVIAPFLPALILSALANHTEKKFYRLVHGRTSTAPEQKSTTTEPPSNPS